MFRKILFPTDFSDYSIETLEHVIGLKDVGLRKVYLVNVLDSEAEYPISLGIKDQMKVKLSEVEKLIKKNDIEVESTVMLGKPDKEIINLSEYYDVSMIVMGSQGLSLLDGAMIGSVSYQVVKNSKKPVFIVRYDVVADKSARKIKKGSSEIFKRILFPMDFSFWSQRALDFIRSFMSAGCQEVIICHIVDDRYLFPYRAKQAQKESKIRLGVIKKELEERGCKARIEVPIGKPTDELLKVANKENVSLAIVGSRGKSIVEEMLLGSVTEHMIRKAACPVLVIHDEHIKPKDA